jgi:magnesium-transporting ATPase (P-type)
MSTLVDVEGRALLYVKGASEIILGACTHVLRNEGSCERMSGEERITFERLIHSYAQEGYRTLCLAYKDLSREEAAQNWEDVPSPDMSDLTLVGIVGIADPVRPEVPQAVAQCQRSGIVVRMV